MNDDNMGYDNNNGMNNDVVNAPNDNQNKQTAGQRVNNFLDNRANKSSQKMGGSKGTGKNNKWRDYSKSKSKNNAANKVNKVVHPPKVSNNMKSGPAKSLNRNPQGPQQENKGANPVDKMKNNGAANDQKAAQREKRMEMALKVAKHIPIPQVKAAATAMENAKKASGGTPFSKKKGGFLGGNDSNGLSSLTMMGSYKRKIILFAIPFLFLLIVIAGLTSSVVSSASESEQEANEATCMLDKDSELLAKDGSKEGVTDECNAGSEEAKAFYERVKEVKREYDEKDKTFSPVYIAGFYVVVSNEDSASGIDYASMTKDKIKAIADAMFDKDGETYTFSEDTFKKNLKNKILPKYISGASSKKLEDVANKIIDYVERYKSIYNIDNLDGENSVYGDSDLANRLVEVAQAQLKKSNSSYYGGAKYWKFMGFSSREEWCACFVSWCANEAGIKTSIIPHTAGVTNFYSYFAIQKHGEFHRLGSKYKPRPGDLIIWENKSSSNPKGISHVGIVEKVKGGKLYTIEGNSGYDPHDRVAHNIYYSVASSGCTGFATPKYPISSGTSTGTIKKGQSIKIPQNFSQSMYTVTGYDYWIKSGRPMVWSAGTNQRRVSNLWKKKGSKFENGIATIDGRYLIAVCETFGHTGDKVDVYLSNGKVLPCIIADAKSQDDKNITKWGHSDGSSINVVEFEVKRSTYYKYNTNPSNGGWNNSWHHKAVKIVNGGSIFKKK